jgi:hypothetical protein
MIELPGIFKLAVPMQIQRLSNKGGRFIPRRNRLARHAQSAVICCRNRMS